MKRYLNDIVSLAVLVMMVIAFVDGQFLNGKAAAANAPAATAIVMDQVRR